ncbi:drug/metabolite transporter (DMT)-like permease [Actinomadura coerulea]|uniref:Drug/metabolite transporter (DMT)-like permease n=1 Tax=Actinomadura coerulea TaxID=46159 RepID=A0A7X0FZF5_9ACTN|nr:DMT family transporter [Actinomadura coerulea]MBB6396516.1 drug/metabolite transporter (DMT)-like permease [Actinomadura coerulea]
MLILLVPSIFQGQVHQAALESVNIGTLMTVVTLGALGLAAWRLLFSAHRSRVRWHALWFVIGVAGVILLTRPFTDGAEIVGLALAGVAAVIGVNATIASGRLTEMGALSRVVELNCWGAACLVGVPVLVWTDDHWVTGYVLSTVAVTSLLNMIANKLHVRAYELVQSDDGLMSSVKCLNPVLACLVGIAVGTGGSPGFSGWIGAVLVVGASFTAFRALHRLGDHSESQTVKGAVWKELLPDIAPNGGAWSGIAPSRFQLPSVWKEDRGYWKYNFA